MRAYADTSFLVKLLTFELECDTFLTADRIQGALARTEGLDVTINAHQ